MLTRGHSYTVSDYWPPRRSWLNYLFYLAVLGNGSSGGSDFTLMTKNQMHRFLNVISSIRIDIVISSLTGELASLF